jgi:acyl-CoA dehydrogenase
VRPQFRELLTKVQQIGTDVVRPAATDVDKNARFPAEAFAALKAVRALSAGIPEELGGLGCGISEMVLLCQALGQHCSATAMIFAMHQIQIACLARHGADQPFFRDYLRDAAERQLLIASATSEVGVGGDMRSSICCVEREGERFRLVKQASVISYGEHADAILASTRRAPESPPSDQVLVLVRREDYQLTRNSNWDTLGMRGTCSPGFTLSAQGGVEQILPVPFADIAGRTMVPYSHLVWTSCWLGIATDAVGRARAFVRADARKRPGTTPFGASRLAQAANLLQTMRAGVFEPAQELERLMLAPDGVETLSSIGYAIKINNLKISASQLVVQIVRETLTICGMAGYSNESKFSMGRQLRDAYSAALMIANDRILATNASLLLVYKDE